MSIRGILGIGAVVSAAALLAPSRSDAVAINVVFTANWNNVNNWPGANPAQQAMNQTLATNCVLQARDNWQNAITDAFNMTVTVDWAVPLAFGNQDSGVCGVGGVLTSQAVGGITKPSTSQIILNRNLNNWFFDPTPAQSEEYNAVPNEPWRGTAIPTGPADGKVDMVSCAKHEFGHALAFLYGSAALGGNGQFQPYINEVNANTGAININDFGGKLLPVGALNQINSASHFLPVGNVPGTMIPMKDLMMVPDVGGQDDDRVFMSPYDVSAVAKVLGLPLNGNYNLYPKEDVPEPATLGLFALAPMMLARRTPRARD